MTDPINALDGLLGRVARGRLHRFSLSRKGDFSGQQAEEIVRRYGVHVWGREADDKEAGFLVPAAQAGWAEYLLLRAGVPLTSALFDPANKVYAQRHEPGSMPTPWGVPATGRGLISAVLHGLDGNFSLAALAMGGVPFLGILGALMRRGRRRKKRRGKRKQRYNYQPELVGLVGLLVVLGVVAVVAFGLAAGG